MSSIPLRSFVKGVCWETFSFIITFFAVYIVYGNFIGSLEFSWVLSVIKILLFFVNERIWKKIRWGKYHVIGDKVIFETGKKAEKKSNGKRPKIKSI